MVERRVGARKVRLSSEQMSGHARDAHPANFVEAESSDAPDFYCRPVASMARHFAAFAVLVAAFCCLNYAAGQQSSVVSVEVYYESLCPDSIYFITQELAPVYDELKDFLKVKLVPFGKASWTVGNDPIRPTEFRCQHGESECQGNRAQVCALHEIQQSVVAEQQQRQSVKVVDCVMSASNPARAVPSCARKNGMSEQSIERINSCSGSDLGDQLLIAAGESTKAFQSPITFVPGIAINGVRNPSAYRNFAQVVCGQIPRNQRPELCTHV